MNRLAVAAMALLAGISSLIPASAQNSNTMNSREPRKIEVTGFAEMEVMPDELYFTVSLREYFKDEKNQKDRVLISTL